MADHHIALLHLDDLLVVLQRPAVVSVVRTELRVVLKRDQYDPRRLVVFQLGCLEVDKVLVDLLSFAARQRLQEDPRVLPHHPILAVAARHP